MRGLIFSLADEHALSRHQLSSQGFAGRMGAIAAPRAWFAPFFRWLRIVSSPRPSSCATSAVCPPIDVKRKTAEFPRRQLWQCWQPVDIGTQQLLKAQHGETGRRTNNNSDGLVRMWESSLGDQNGDQPPTANRTRQAIAHAVLERQLLTPYGQRRWAEPVRHVSVQLYEARLDRASERQRPEALCPKLRVLFSTNRLERCYGGIRISQHERPVVDEGKAGCT